MKSISFKTAQYVQIDYELANPFVRAVASFIDVVAFLIYFVVMGMIFSNNYFDAAGIDLYTALWNLLVYIPWVLYSPMIEYLTNGRSLGKWILGIRVVKVSGETAGLREYFSRWIFRVIDIWVGGFGFLALVIAGSTERAQRMGDIMADTVMIKTQNSQIFSLNDVLSIKSTDNHQVKYPNVIRFSDEDMMLIKNTILRIKRYPNDANRKFGIELANETARLIGMEEPPAKKMEFLMAVLQDYVVLTR